MAAAAAGRRRHSGRTGRAARAGDARSPGSPAATGAGGGRRWPGRAAEPPPVGRVEPGVELADRQDERAGDGGRQGRLAGAVRPEEGHHEAGSSARPGPARRGPGDGGRCCARPAAPAGRGLEPESEPAVGVGVVRRVRAEPAPSASTSANPSPARIGRTAAQGCPTSRAWASSDRSAGGRSRPEPAARLEPARRSRRPAQGWSLGRPCPRSSFSESLNCGSPEGVSWISSNGRRFGPATPTRTGLPSFVRPAAHRSAMRDQTSPEPGPGLGLAQDRRKTTARLGGSIAWTRRRSTRRSRSSRRPRTAAPRRPDLRAAAIRPVKR